MKGGARQDHPGACLSAIFDVNPVTRSAIHSVSCGEKRIRKDGSAESTASASTWLPHGGVREYHPLVHY
jgi:hypothetical protein